MKKRFERPGTRTVRRLRQLDLQKHFEKQEQQEEERIYSRKVQKKERKLKEAILDYSAYKLERKWSYRKLMQAADEVDATKGRDVHGWMEKVFPNYDWLIENDVLDRACYLAYKDFRPDVFNHVEGVDLTKWNRELVLLPEKTHFDYHSEFEFNRFVIYCKEPIAKGVNRIPNYPWVLDGYPTEVTLRPCNLLNLGLPLWDLPVFMVKDAPGKNKEFFTAKVKSTQLTEEREELIRSFVYKARIDEKDADKIKDELKLESKSARKMYSDLKKKMLSRAPFADEREFERFERQYYTSKRPRWKPNWKKIILTLIFIILAIVILVFLQYLFLTPVPTTIPEASTGSISFFNFFLRS